MVRIRCAEEMDRRDVEIIARNTWEGRDYISQEFSHWLDDGNFYVIEAGGKVVGTGKITILPGDVGWLEGLRVHPAYQNQGLGRMMHNFLIKRAREINDIRVLEFATHKFNRESVSMALKDGFFTAKRFYLCIRKRENGADFDRASVEYDDLEWKDYVPCGWKFLRIVSETPEYLRKCGNAGVTQGCKFIYPYRNTEVAITPAIPTTECFERVIPAANRISEYKKADTIAFMVPENRRDIVEYLASLGFESWVRFEEPDVLIFRKYL